MKKIMMKTLAAGPSGSLIPGQVVSLPDEEAKQMVNGGYAVYEENKAAEVETATAEPPENTMRKPATKRKAGRKG